MKIDWLIEDCTNAEPSWASLEVTGVQSDSRRVRAGDLFVAVKGLTVDGHDFAQAAAEAGAAAVVAARDLELSIPCLVVGDPARALGQAAARLASDPAASLELIGITGTNGKTTTSFLMEAMLRSGGLAPGVIGTVEYRYAGRTEPAPFTTPPPEVLQDLLARMVAGQCSHAVMEVSSHALQMGRVWGCTFAVAAFTHLTQDHLDLHGSMDAYMEAKLLLFTRHLRPGGTAVVNLDGAGADRVIAAVRRRGDVNLVTCSRIRDDATAVLLDARYSIDGLRAALRIGDGEVTIRSGLLGGINGDNILMAAACCRAAGVDLPELARGAERVRGVPGRLERVDPGAEIAVLVDYAHTPDALARAMEVLRPLCAGRLITVFGCGGDRDQGKRPLMGRAVAAGADLAVVTSDNPRTEDPSVIIEQILVGVRQEDFPGLATLDAGRGFVVQADRRRAIEVAVAAARAGDVVLIAGKGHEDYQILGARRIHFDDREEARAALEKR